MAIKLIVFIIVIGFSAIQSLIKSAQDKARQEQLRGGNRQAEVGPPNRKQAAKNEIEAFLREATGISGGRQEAEAEQARQRRQKRERRREQAEAKRVAAERKKQQEKKKPRTSVKSSIGSHVDSYINKHVNEYLDHDVDEYVEATIVDSVNGNLGDRAAEMPASRSKPADAPSKSIIALLRNPEGVRNAILVNEILTRPKALRK